MSQFGNFFGLNLGKSLDLKFGNFGLKFGQGSAGWAPAASLTGETPARLWPEKHRVQANFRSLVRNILNTAWAVPTPKTF